MAGAGLARGEEDWSGLYFGMGGAGSATHGVVTTNGYGSSETTQFAAAPMLAIGANLDTGRFVLGLEGDITPLGFHASGTTTGGVTGDADFDALKSLGELHTWPR